MNCERARELVVSGNGWVRRWWARRHVRRCSDCTAWFSNVHKMAGVLENVARYEMPESLHRKLRDTVHANLPADAGIERRSKMGKMVLGAVTLAVVVGIVFAAFSVLSPGGGNVAWADIQRALLSVKTVHMTGEVGTTEQNQEVPLAVHKEKWIRREPFAVYEEVTPVKPGSAQHYIFAGDTEHVYWYFPDRGNRAVMGNGLNADFLNSVLSPLEESGSSGAEPRFKLVGKSEIDGRRVILLELSDGQTRTELAVDMKTKLTLRLSQYHIGADGKPVEITQLRFDYNQSPPSGVFEWQPPAGASVVEKRSP